MIGKRPFVLISVGVCYLTTTFTIKPNQSKQTINKQIKSNASYMASNQLNWISGVIIPTNI